MKNESKKEEVVYNPAMLLKNFIIYQILILYITLQIGDMVLQVTELGSLITRYVPIGIVTLISAFLTFKKCASKCLIKDKEEVKKKVILAPVIVAVILLGYGLYSVESNISSIRDELNSSSYSQYSIYSMFMSDEEIEQQLDEATRVARTNWLITSIVYLVVAEFVAVMVNKKLDDWLKLEDETVEESNNLVNDTSTFSELPTEDVSENNETSISNIKWDL